MGGWGEGIEVDCSSLIQRRSNTRIPSRQIKRNRVSCRRFLWVAFRIHFCIEGFLLGTSCRQVLIGPEHSRSHFHLTSGIRTQPIFRRCCNGTIWSFCGILRRSYNKLKPLRHLWLVPIACPSFCVVLQIRRTDLDN
jgi:hypothetical protein